MFQLPAHSTIALTGGELPITRHLTITGPGADLLTISGNFASRIFSIGGFTFSLSGATLRDGNGGGVGGAISANGNLNLSQCVVAGSSATGSSGGGVYLAGGVGTFDSCTFNDNRASDGAGIDLINASASFTNCTFSGNVSAGGGGAISFRAINGGASKTLNIFDSTIAFNSSPGAGGIAVTSEVVSVTATATLKNTIIANNRGNGLAASGPASSIVSQGFNLASDSGGGFLIGAQDQVNTDPKLGPLALGGGTTPTHALLGGSPAIDAGNSSGTLVDQRGLQRGYAVAIVAGGDASDIGAVEMQYIVVNSTTSDVGTGLSDAISTANAASNVDIIFDPSVFGGPQTISLSTALPDITASMTINGPGANLLTVRRDYAAPAFSVFYIPAGGLNVALTGMTISNGNGTGGFGGGIASFSSLTLSHVRVAGNQASTAGGGITLSGSDGTFSDSSFDDNVAGIQGGGIDYESNSGHRLLLTSVTVSGNSANGPGFGGGIAHVCFSANCTLTLVNSTIADNTATGFGAILTAAAGGDATTTLRNSIIANNSPANLSSFAPDGVATVISLGFNLASDDGASFLDQATDQVSADPKLGPLSLAGGATPTHALLGGSPALDKGHNSGHTTDQRGAARAFDVAGIAPPSGGDNADIGAVEMQAIVVTSAASSGAGSLNAAIAAANANGTGLDDIVFASPLFSTPQTIGLAAALPDIAGSVTINGPGANLLTVQRNRSAAEFPIFNIPSSGLDIAITGMTIANGVDVVGFGAGVTSASNLALTGVHVTGNRAATGGGVGLYFADGTFTNSTFSDNRSSTSAGGIAFEGDGGHRLQLVNSTLSGNVGNCAVGNFAFDGSSALEIVNSTIARNRGNNCGAVLTYADGAGTSAVTSLRNSILDDGSATELSLLALNGGGPATLTSQGFNLTSGDGDGLLAEDGDQTGTDPRLGPLSLNGATTPTHALLGGSPAMDQGDRSGLGADQRGAPRAADATADIGAVEMQAITVTNADSDGSGSLNDAIATANGSGPGLHDIIFASPLFDSEQTIALSTALPGIAANVAINGPSASLLTVRRGDAAPNFSIFRVPGFGLNVAINGMTISNGHNAIESGGGIESYSDLALASVFVTGNYALQYGGGVAMNAGSATITGSTFTNNYAANYGGGLYIGGNRDHVLRLTGSTVSGNAAVNGGGGIVVLPLAAGITSSLAMVNSAVVNNIAGGIETNAVAGTAVTTLRNSIVSGNAMVNFHNSGSGAAVVSDGFNLSGAWNGVATVGSDLNAVPRLGPIGYYGGPTPTHVLLDDSPALDAGDSSGSTNDQRGFGFLRPVNLGFIGTPPSDAADIGPWEAQSRDILYINGFDND
jgi:hypothetical protein